MDESGERGCPFEAADAMRATYIGKAGSALDLASDLLEAAKSRALSAAVVVEQAPLPSDNFDLMKEIYERYSPRLDYCVSVVDKIYARMSRPDDRLGPENDVIAHLLPSQDGDTEMGQLRKAQEDLTFLMQEVLKAIPVSGKAFLKERDVSSEEPMVFYFSFLGKIKESLDRIYLINTALREIVEDAQPLRRVEQNVYDDLTRPIPDPL